MYCIIVPVIAYNIYVLIDMCNSLYIFLVLHHPMAANDNKNPGATGTPATPTVATTTMGETPPAKAVTPSKGASTRDGFGRVPACVPEIRVHEHNSLRFAALTESQQNAEADELERRVFGETCREFIERHERHR